jgi:hypothetical protein
VENIYYSNGWSEKSIFPKESSEETIKSYIGKTYRVLLPIQIENVVNEYLFSFQVTNVTIKELEQPKEKAKKSRLRYLPFVGVLVVIVIGIVIQ